MGMGEAVKSVLSNYAKFDGRARRSEFWFWVLATFVVGVVLGIIRAVAGGLGVALEVVFFLATIVPNLAVSSRRLHDTGKSGWLTLLYFPGFILLIPLIVVIIFWCQDSQADNQYGPSPKALGGGYAEPGYPAPGSYPPPPPNA